MKTELIIALLGMACIGSLAAFFVAWAKADEYKHKAKDERENYLAALRLHNTTAEALERSEEQQRCSAQAVLWYSKKLAACKEQFVACRNGNMILQDKLSAVICPANNHVWRDGVCAKCGRVKDALP